VMMLFSSGCLKDDDFDKGLIQSTHGDVPKVIEIGLTTTNTSNFLVFAVDNSKSDTTVDLVPVTLAAKDPASEDIHVTVDPDPSLIDAYNDENGTEYVVPSPDLYTIVNPVVTIPKGSRTGFLQVKFTPFNYLSGDKALGFKISNVQEPGYVISGNLNSGITNLAVKNDYDGVYEAAGHFDHPVYAGDYDAEWTLITTGPTSLTFQLITTVIFAVNVTITVDPVTNLVSLSTPDVALDPYDPQKNYYTPADRTFHLDFGYSGGSRHLTGTATYEHPR
jgi:hypothetical protein